jgi:hypothetical protein
VSFSTDSGQLRRPPAGVLDETFGAFVFAWEGTAVADRRADATGVRQRLEAASAAGVHAFVVSGSHVGEVDRQLLAKPSGPGRLHLCLDDGSEVFEVTSDGPTLVWQRTTSNDEERSLDLAAALMVSRLRERGVDAQVVGRPMGRRKVDLIPDAGWADPRNGRLDELLDAVTARLRTGGIASLAEVVAMAATRPGRPG